MPYFQTTVVRRRRPGMGSEGEDESYNWSENYGQSQSTTCDPNVSYAPGEPCAIQAQLNEQAAVLARLAQAQPKPPASSTAADFTAILRKYQTPILWGITGLFVLSLIGGRRR